MRHLTNENLIQGSFRVWAQLMKEGVTYYIMPSLIGRVHTQNDPWYLSYINKSSLFLLILHLMWLHLRAQIIIQIQPHQWPLHGLPGWHALLYDCHSSIMEEWQSYNRAYRPCGCSSGLCWVSHCSSFEGRVPVDEIYGCPISYWVAETWLYDRVPG